MMRNVYKFVFVCVLGMFLFARPVHANIPLNDLSQDVPTLAPILQGANPAVVNITATQKVERDHVNHYRDPFNDPFFKHFFGDFGLRQYQQPRSNPHYREGQSIGSGVIVDAKNGYILTNHHVIKNADEIHVILHDKRKLEAEQVGSDPDTDIAVLKVKGKNLTSVPFGNSTELQVGDFVLAIGNPFGLTHTVTSGIVSALGRSGLGLEGYEDFIQTDAPINPGNSGGALINLKGELIGINTAIYSKSGGSMGIGFAIPSQMAQAVMQQIVKHGEVKRGRIGVHVQNISSEIAEAMSLDLLSGALVSKVVEGSTAEKAGVLTGDIITHVNSKEVKDSSNLKNLIGMMRVDEKATLQVLRDGKKRQIVVPIGKPDDDGQMITASSVELFEGAKFSKIPEDHEFYKKRKGVYVSSVEYGSPSWRAGLREGDLIVSVNQVAVSNVKEMTKAAHKSNGGILLNVQRQQMALFLVVS